jgi:hypothetical protein
VQCCLGWPGRSPWITLAARLSPRSKAEVHIYLRLTPPTCCTWGLKAWGLLWGHACSAAENGGVPGGDVLPGLLLEDELL